VELHVASPWPGGASRQTVLRHGTTWHLVPVPARGRSLCLFQFDTHWYRPVFQAIRPEVIHAWGVEDSYGLVARRLAPRNHVIGIQGLIATVSQHGRPEWRMRLTRLTEKLSLARARWVVAESEFAASATRPLAPQARIRVIDHVVREEFTAGEPAAPDATRAIFVGSLLDRKGIFDAVRAFGAVANPAWHLDVIGTGPAGAADAIRRLAGELGVLERVHLHGILEAADLAQALRRSSVFLLPTWIDTGPTSLKEALCLGVWPVCYDNSGPAEYLRRFGYGTLAKDRDVGDLARALGDVFATRPWQDLGRRNQVVEQARACFSRQRAWPQLAELYRMVIAEARGSEPAVPVTA